jgi:prephenate dehydratase
MRVAYLGPAGSLSEEAARRLAPQAGESLPEPDMASVVTAIEQGRAEVGVLPIENSLEGAVSHAVDLLIHARTARICAEAQLRVEHCLLGAPGLGLDLITSVYSHPQAIAQCERWLRQHLARAEQIPTSSTSAAAQTVRRRRGAAAIASRRSAEIYDLAILVPGIEDGDENVTRFVAVGLTQPPATGSDRTSICCATDRDRPGALLDILRPFAIRGVNLSKIESRPTKEALGHYYFLIDLEGHSTEPNVAEALREAASATEWLKILGSYPRADP